MRRVNKEALQKQCAIHAVYTRAQLLVSRGRRCVGAKSSLELSSIAPPKHFLSIETVVILSLCMLTGCRNRASSDGQHQNRIAPVVVTEPVDVDADDPAIWIHPADPAKSVILGTDKGGALFAFSLDGKIIQSVKGFQRLNNVDVEYGLALSGVLTDIAVATDRDANTLRVFRLPNLALIDGGGIPAFEGEAERRPMGIALYTRPSDGAIFAIVSRKEAPSDRYLWQYRLADDGSGRVHARKVREFGAWSGKNAAGEGEIEAVAVDAVSGYVYYADELFGIRKYHADPDAPEADRELAVFGKEGFTSDREGISIYTVNEGTGYIIVSDQQANTFRIFTRGGTPSDPHRHELVKTVKLSTNASDGSELTSVWLSEAFPGGLFVAMSEDKTFHLYSWTQIAGNDLLVAPHGERGKQ